MEQRKIMAKSRRRAERMVLMVYAFYAVVLSVMAIAFHWGSWIIPVVVFGFALNVLMHRKEYRDYKFRAYMISGLILVDYFIYGIYSDTYLSLISSICVVVVLLSLFQIERIMLMIAVVTALLNIYHAFIIRTMVITDRGSLAMTILHCLLVFVVEALAYYLIRSQNMAEEAMLQELDSLEQMEQSKDDFMANLSHEVRTPVNTVVGMTEMILHENVSEPVREYAMSVQTASRNLLATVSDVLDFSELQSGKIAITEEPYNLTSTINDILNVAMAQKQGKKIEIIVDCDPRIPCSLLGDEQKISRVILNIVNNALKFTEEGAIVIQAAMRKEQEGINLIIKIRDTGIGIEEKNIERLFTSFNQVDTKRNRQEGGIGLGLAISKAIVEQMRGFINVRSRLGEGTEVQFVIPQKVLDNSPMIKLEKRDEIRLLYYINMTKYEYGSVRDEYRNCIEHMKEQLGMDATGCRNLAELKRRVDQEKYTHLFISWEEYMEDRKYFHSIQEELCIILIMDERPDIRVGAHIRQIFKPFYVLSVATVLNGEDVGMTLDTANLGTRRFVAPEASVLVVDDNIMNLKVMEGLLRPYKIKVFSAGSGSEALEKLSTMAYDFVFMDHMMPEMDGVECFHRIRKRPGKYFQTVPIVALTANAIAGAREMFLSEGFQDFVAKPVEISVLEHVLRKYIPEEKIQNVKSWKRESEETLPEAGEMETEILTAATAGKEAEAKNTEENKKRNIPKEESLKKILMEANVDIDAALALYGGEMDFYREMLEIFVENGPDRIKEVEEAYRSADWKEYTILVHAVKSNAGSIGAERLAAMAKALEMAGKEDRITYIREQHKAMLTQYRITLEAAERVTG